MGDVTQYLFTYREVVEAMIKQQDLHEGIWQLYMEFGLAAANIPQPGEATFVPAAIVAVNKIGLIRVEKENNMAVNAALVNPLKR